MDLKREIRIRDEKLDNAMRVLKLLHDKCRQGFLEISKGNEAYDELQKIMK